MALIDQTALKTLDYSYYGVPFCNVVTKSTIDTTTMDYSYYGVPFVTNPFSSATTSNIKTFWGLPYAQIKSINGLAIASVKTFNGLS